MKAFVVTVVTKASDQGATQSHEYLTVAENGAQARLHALTEHRSDPARAGLHVITTAVQDSSVPSSRLLQTREITEADLQKLGQLEPLYRVG